MAQQIYIFDPTTRDTLSKVRGIGRYLQILHENLENDCVFTHDISAIPSDATFINPFFNILSAPLITKRIADRQIAVIHDLIPIKYPQHFPAGIRGHINIFRNKRTLKNYDAIITDSKTSKKDIVSLLGVSENTVHVVYPIAAKIFHDLRAQTSQPIAQSPPPKTPYCIYVGDATWNKNLVTLAQAIKLANISCVFVGKIFSTPATDHPWQKEYKEFKILTADVTKFIFPGFVSDSQLADLYYNAVCNVLVSKDEGFGFSYVEAATLGVPSVLSNIPVLHETAQSTALFADSNNPDEIAKAIQIYSTDLSQRKQFGEASRKRSKFFNPETFRTKLLSIAHT